MYNFTILIYYKKTFFIIILICYYIMFTNYEDDRFPKRVFGDLWF